jgi:pyruvate/2-oxoacid:ferredoxin oxidoreductase alpha subunit
MAFKIAEDHRVILPIIVNMDGFIPHVVEAHELLIRTRWTTSCRCWSPIISWTPPSL